MSRPKVSHMGAFNKCEHGIVRETGMCEECPHHCGQSEPCADDVYCNCWCQQCVRTECYRPGCQCQKSHQDRDVRDKTIAEWDAYVEKKYGDKDHFRKLNGA